MPDIVDWYISGKQFALARVIATWGSSPRRPGAAMIISAAGEVHGSVSGGCVESEVMEAAQHVLATGIPQRLEFGIADETAWSQGLSCGGKLSVWVEPFTPERWGGVLEPWQEALAANHRITLHTPLRANELPFVRPSGSTAILEEAGKAIFVQDFPPQNRVLLFGAGHVTLPLVKILNVMGMTCVVIDPRSVFTQKERFGDAEAKILTAWPQEVAAELNMGPSDFVVLLTHNPKIDDPALTLALNGNVAYIGALGSRKTQAKRRQRFLEKGFSAAQLDRIHGPVGLDLGGGRSPEEIALSIAAQIVQVQNIRSAPM